MIIFFYWHKWNLFVMLPIPAFLDVLPNVIILGITHINCGQLLQLLFTCSYCAGRDKKAKNQINTLHLKSCSLLEH